MAMDSRSRTLSYRGGAYLLLALLIILLVGGIIVYRYSLITHYDKAAHLDEGIFYAIIGIAVGASIIATLLALRLNRNIRNLKRVAQAMESGADIDSMPDFARDEIGDISRHIIDLYQRLRQASSDVEREHDRALHEEQEKLRIKRQLTNNINHELKTPVAAIQGYLETMLNNKDMSEEQRDEFMRKCYTNSQRLTQLLHDVSTITRLEDGISRIERDKVDLGAILDEICSDVAVLPDGKRMRMNITMERPVTVYGNASLVMSIFKNLTDNAIAYSGGRDIYITITDSEEVYNILFADNGIGIEEEHLNHIFERFYRIDEGRSRKLGGTGLGLSIVKNAVLFHGGEVEVCNRKMGGLEYRFTLPKAK